MPLNSMNNLLRKKLVARGRYTFVDELLVRVLVTLAMMLKSVQCMAVIMTHYHSLSHSSSSLKSLIGYLFFFSASGKAGLVSAYGTTIGAVVVLGIATSPAGGVGVIAAPVIGGAVGLVIGIGGTLGGLLIGAGHACATPFIELGKAARKPTVYEEKPYVLFIQSVNYFDCLDFLLMND